MSDGAHHDNEMEICFWNVIQYLGGNEFLHTVIEKLHCTVSDWTLQVATIATCLLELFDPSLKVPLMFLVKG